MTVQGKGYLHPDGRVAVSRLRLDALLEYIPKGPSERVVSVDYSIGGQPRSSSRVTAKLCEGGVAAELQHAAWGAGEP